MIVRHVLLDGGPVSPLFGVGDLGFVGVNVQESGEDTRGVSESDNGTEGSETQGRYLAADGSREGH